MEKSKRTRYITGYVASWAAGYGFKTPHYTHVCDSPEAARGEAIMQGAPEDKITLRTVTSAYPRLRRT